MALSKMQMELLMFEWIWCNSKDTQLHIHTATAKWQMTIILLPTAMSWCLPLVVLSETAGGRLHESPLTDGDGRTLGHTLAAAALAAEDWRPTAWAQPLVMVTEARIFRDNVLL